MTKIIGGHQCRQLIPQLNSRTLKDFRHELGAKVRVAEFDRLLQGNADDPQQIIHVLLTAADEDLQHAFHFFHLAIRNLKLINNTCRIWIFAICTRLNILLHKTAIQRIVRVLAAEAVQLG
ncbi:hypothetical protein D3C76_1288790 [compost metagenome]